MVPLYSRAWFETISVRNFAQTQFPDATDIQPSSTRWLKTAAGIEDAFLPTELVPRREDLQSLYEQSKKERDAGNIFVSFRLSTQPRVTRVWSLTKVRIGNEYASHARRIENARKVVAHLDVRASRGRLADAMDTINHQSMFSERGEAFTAVSYPDFEVLRPFQQLSDTIIDFYLFQVRKLFLADTIILSAGFNRDLELAFQKGGAVPAERTRLDRIGTARFVGWVHYEPMHWTTVLVDRSKHALFYGCSLGGKIGKVAKTHIDWLFDQDGTPLQLDSLHTDIQYDGVSCGLAAISMLIHGLLDITHTVNTEARWTYPTTEQYRDQIFDECILSFHVLPESVNSPIKNDEIVVCSPSNLTSQQQTNTLRDVSPTGPTRTAPKQAFVSSPTTSDETEFDKTNLAPSPAVSVDSLPGLSQLEDWYKNTNVPINKTSISDDNQSLRSTFLFEEDDRFSTISTSDEPSSEFSSSPGSSESGLISSLPSSLTRLASREFDDLEAAIASCCAAATRDGFVLHRDSSQMGVVEGETVMIWKRLRCKNWNSAVAETRKSKTIDPANTRRTKTAPKKCPAMINLRLVGKGPEWHITKVDWTHNHDPDPLLQSQSKPHHPTQVEKDLIRRLVSGNAGNISRSQALQCVLVIVPDTKLELQQVSNIINTAKNDRQVEYAKKGGDAASLLVWLAAQKDKDQGFRYACQVHKETGALRRLFVCSAEMVNALQRFGDVIIADVAQGRNIYQMPLNIFCVVDGAGRTRNVAYVVQDREDKEAHQWALEQLIITSGFEPSVVMSDQDSAFISADVVDILRKHCTIGAIVVSMKAMKQAMFYRVTPVELPSKLANEDPKPTPSPERFVEVPTPDMTDDDDDESVMSWDGANNSDGDDGDNAEVQNELEPVQENEQQYEFDPSYLAAMVEASGTTLLRAYDIRRRGTPASRILLVADDGKFYCTCAEGIATGIPCRHMWAAIGDGEYFQLQQVNPRWHLDRLAAVDVKPVQLKVPILTVPFPKKTIPVRLPGEQDDFRPDYAAKGKIRVSDSYGRAAAGARSIAVVINTEERAREIEQMLADQR
ncbi:unnamed protein product [Tilletia controversa]|nr:unnamed protein product [Tilletia controversa]